MKVSVYKASQKSSNWIKQVLVKILGLGSECFLPPVVAVHRMVCTYAGKHFILYVSIGG